MENESFINILVFSNDAPNFNLNNVRMLVNFNVALNVQLNVLPLF